MDQQAKLTDAFPDLTAAVEPEGLIDPGPNRLNILERLGELAQHKSRKRPISPALLDIYHFRKYNDNFGRQLGDVNLREMARLVRDRLSNYYARGYHIIVRLGMASRDEEKNPSGKD